METTALCSANSFDYIRELGAEDAVDYHQKDWLAQLSQKPKSFISSFFCFLNRNDFRFLDMILYSIQSVHVLIVLN
jgi:hypothetical protein